MAESERRRRRPAVYGEITPQKTRSFMLIVRRSCTHCRRRKVRCNRESPCSNCVRTRKDTCTYDTDSHFAPLTIRKQNPRVTQTTHDYKNHSRDPTTSFDHDYGRHPGSNHLSMESSATSPSVVASSRPGCSPVESSTLADTPIDALPSSYDPKQNVEATERRTTQVEERHSTATSPKKSAGPAALGLFSTKTVSYLANSHTVHESRLFGSCQVISRGTMHKSRLFGQSHWSNGIAEAVSTYYLRLTTTVLGLHLNAIDIAIGSHLRAYLWHRYTNIAVSGLCHREDDRTTRPDRVFEAARGS